MLGAAVLGVIDSALRSPIGNVAVMVFQRAQAIGSFIVSTALAIHERIVAIGQGVATVAGKVLGSVATFASTIGQRVFGQWGAWIDALVGRIGKAVGDTSRLRRRHAKRRVCGAQVHRQIRDGVLGHARHAHRGADRAAVFNEAARAIWSRFGSFSHPNKSPWAGVPSRSPSIVASDCASSTALPCGWLLKKARVVWALGAASLMMPTQGLNSPSA